MRSVSKSVVALSLAILGGVHCATSTDIPEDSVAEAPSEDVADATNDDEESIASTSQALSAHCWAQIQRPSPSSLVLPIGTQLTLRTSSILNCLGGVLPERLSYRFYVEGPSGKISPQGATDWSTSRLVPFDTTDLLPGRYRIYVYSLPTSLVPAWKAGDLVARAASVRSGYSYVVLGATSWSATEYSECSAPCGGGTRTRTVKCTDGASRVIPDAYCDAGSKPAASAECNPSACGDVDVGASTVAGTCGVMGVQGPGFLLTAGPAEALPVGTTITVTGSGVANIGVFSVSGMTATVTVLSPTSRKITLTSPLAAGAQGAMRTTLSTSIAFALNSIVTLPSGYIATGAKITGGVSSTLVMCTGS